MMTGPSLTITKVTRVSDESQAWNFKDPMASVAMVMALVPLKNVPMDIMILCP